MRMVRYTIVSLLKIDCRIYCINGLGIDTILAAINWKRHRHEQNALPLMIFLFNMLRRKGGRIAPPVIRFRGFTTKPVPSALLRAALSRVERYYLVRLGGSAVGQLVRRKNGEGGIRTRGPPKADTGFRDRLDQPLRHLSECKLSIFNCQLSMPSTAKPLRIRLSLGFST